MAFLPPEAQLSPGAVQRCDLSRQRQITELGSATFLLGLTRLELGLRLGSAWSDSARLGSGFQGAQLKAILVPNVGNPFCSQMCQNHCNLQEFGNGYGKTKSNSLQQLRAKLVQFRASLSSAWLGFRSTWPANQPTGLSSYWCHLGLRLARPAKQPALLALALGSAPCGSARLPKVTSFFIITGTPYLKGR